MTNSKTPAAAAWNTYIAAEGDADRAAEAADRADAGPDADRAANEYYAARAAADRAAAAYHAASRL